MDDERPPEETDDDDDFSAADNGLAIAGFILAFLLAPLGLILSLVGLNKSKEVGGQGRDLAIAGIVVSSLGLILFFGPLVLTGGLWWGLTSGPGLDPRPSESGFVIKQFNADDASRAVRVVDGNTNPIKTVSGQFRYQPATPEGCRYYLSYYSEPRADIDPSAWMPYSDYLAFDPSSAGSDLSGPGSFFGKSHYVLAQGCGDWQLIDELAV